MSGINPALILTGVPRLRVTFRDDSHTKVVIATGFWIHKNGNDYFVTNKHNLDARPVTGESSGYKLDVVEIQLRRRSGNHFFPETRFFEIEHPTVKLHESADVAIIPTPTFRESDQAFGYTSVDLSEVADADFYQTKLAALDSVSFFGFPGRKGEPWWDTAWDAAIARPATLASYPAIPFSNESIKTADVQLVSGLSFSGSSGSPVFSHEKGIRLGPGLTGGGHIPVKLIGIMSGHWWNQEPQSGMLFHSGLSYLTRSTSILHLVP